MKISTKKWIILFAAAAGICAAVFLLVRFLGPKGTVAVISVDGEVIRRVALTGVDRPYDIEIRTEYGHNTVHVEEGAVSVTAADCPDRICVHQGRVTTAGIPIVWMPHRLVIQIEGDAVDAWS
jgi:hypothetical protein